MIPAKPAYRDDITGLRAVAVMAVVLCHLRIPGFQGGYVGVDIFFVISGFLITRNILNDVSLNRFSFAEFYTARARRIVPPLFVTMLLSLSAGALLMSPMALQSLAFETLWSAIGVSNIYFWLTSGYFSDEAYTKPLLHTWSLGVEEQFYLFWPVALVLFSKHGRRLVVGLIAVAAIVSFAAAEFHVSNKPTAVFFLTPFRIYEFAIGALLNLLPRRRLNNALKNAGLIAGLSLIALAIYLFTPQSRFPGLSALLPCIGAALCIYVGVNRGVAATILANRVSVFLGRVSYSLYLIHWPVIVFYEYALYKKVGLADAALLIGPMIALSYLMFRYIEQPFRQNSIGLSRPSFARLSMAGAGSLAIVAISAAQTGWLWRLNPSLPIFDQTVPWQKFHMTYYGGANCPLPRCETASGQPQFVVIGDSHARALHAGLRSLDLKGNIAIYGPNACPMYSLRYGSIRNQFTQKCDEARSIAWEELKQPPETIVVHQHWTALFDKPHYSSAGERRQFDDPGQYGRFVAEQLADLKQRLGIQRLIVIGGVPRFGDAASPLDCVNRPLVTGRCLMSDRANPFIDVAARINEAIAKHSGTQFEFIDPYTALCNDGNCRNFDKTGNPIYSDQTHLSGWGSTLLITLIARLFDEKTSASDKP